MTKVALLVTITFLPVQHTNIEPLIENINNEYKGRYSVLNGVNPSIASTEEFLMVTFECIEGNIEKADMITMTTQQGPNLNS